MALKINTFGAVKRCMKVGVYGAFGSGKTRFCLDGGTKRDDGVGVLWPNPLFINAEHGVDAYEAMFPGRAYSVNVASLRDVEEVIAMVRADNGRTYGTLVIDPWTVIRDNLREAVYRNKESRNKEVGIPENVKINREMDFLANHLTGMPVHVLITAHETEDFVDGKYTGETRPDVNKKWMGFFDIVLQFLPRPDVDTTVAIVRKIRGDYDLGDRNFRLQNPNFRDHFAPIAEIMARGEYRESVDNETAILTDMQRIDVNQSIPEIPKVSLRNPEFAKKWQADWQLQDYRLDVPTMRQILGIKLFSEWEVQGGSPKSADEVIVSWLEANPVAELA